MCGIAGTIFRRDFHKGHIVAREDLERTLSAIEEGSETLDALLNKSWKYKSNATFLRYYRDEEERSFVDRFCKRLESLEEQWVKEIQGIDKKHSPRQLIAKYNDYQKLLDCHWFLENEISNWRAEIHGLLGNDKEGTPDSAIIFYKDLLSVINAIDNRLEIRGRDSLGLSIQLYSKDFGLGTITSDISNGNSASVHFERYGNSQVLSLIFKTANRIGSLGENAEKIKDLIRDCQPLEQVIHEETGDCGTIVAHTRWASVGEVSITNCHPIANIGNTGKITFPLNLACMNGDIYNYDEIIKRKQRELNPTFDSECSTDCLALAALFTKQSAISATSFKDAVNTLKGSFAVTLQHSTAPGSLLLAKRGIQGLYIGFSYDNVMFASDVYGLVETCRYFSPIKSGSVLSVSRDTPAYDQHPVINIHNLENDTISSLTSEALRTTPITTRDISKRGYDHFLEKEIFETKDIVQKTALSYLQPPKLIDKEDYGNAIAIDGHQVPDHIMHKFTGGKIKEIIITGMGTCYTAAVAISRYMRDMLRHYRPDITVEPHIPSEGSAFYLRQSMEDTLVIVIAQSGTTVDTNVYVQLAKDRGASSLAIANKREGDVTFIVDGTLYIGGGRDIEIAVPSTKTYTAQVVLGYMLTLYFCCRLNQLGRKHNAFLAKHIESIRGVTDLIDKTFRALSQRGVFDKVHDYPLRTKFWYLAYDYSPNAVCAMEIKIKYSECCYHCIPHLHIDELTQYDVRESFITYITSEKLDAIIQRLTSLLENNNKLILITAYDEIPDGLREYLVRGSLSIIRIPYVDQDYSFLPTAIAGQLLGYYTALALDSRKRSFLPLMDAVKSGTNVSDIEAAWTSIQVDISKGTFNQGFSASRLEHLEEVYEAYKDTQFRHDSAERIELLGYTEKLYQFSRRPVDTIKHQAKTITVGAIREMSSQGHQSYLESDYVEPMLTDMPAGSELDELFRKITVVDDLQISERIGSRREFYVYPVDVNLSYGYYIVNFLNDFSHRFNLGYKFNLARHYDVTNKHDPERNFWILLCHSRSERLDSIVRKKRDNSYVFEYNELSLPPSPSLKQYVVYHALGSLHISACLARNISHLEGLTETWDEYASKECRILGSAWKYVVDSQEFQEDIKNASRVFVGRENWKCLGSGINYNISMLTSKEIISRIGRPCAFDVLENHKHIDISAEAAILVIIANIWRTDYQNDAFSEIEKMVSHDNIPIIFTNLFDHRFDEMQMKVDDGRGGEKIQNIPVVKLPRVSEVFSFPLNVKTLDRFVQELAISL